MLSKVLAVVALFLTLGGSEALSAQELSSTPSWDGLYVGYQLPDAIAHNTRATKENCPGIVPREVFISNGAATMFYNNGYTIGKFDASSNQFNLNGASRGVSLWKDGNSLMGRVLAGGGPWCKYTLKLERLPKSPVPPVSLVNHFNGLYRPPSSPFCTSMDKAEFYADDNFDLYIKDGLATLKIRGRTAFGFISSNGDARLVGLKLDVVLTKITTGYEAAITDEGMQAQPELGWAALPPCQMRMAYRATYHWN